MGSAVRFQNLWQAETRRLILFMGMIVAAILVIQSFDLPYKNVLSSLFPVDKSSTSGKSSFLVGTSSPQSVVVAQMTNLNGSNSINSTVAPANVTNNEASNEGKPSEHKDETKGKDKDLNNDNALDRNQDNYFYLDKNRDEVNITSSEKHVELSRNSTIDNKTDPYNSSPLEKATEHVRSFDLEHASKQDLDASQNTGPKEEKDFTLEEGGNSDTGHIFRSPSLPQAVSSTSRTSPEKLDPKSGTSMISVNYNASSVDNHTAETFSKTERAGLSILQNGSTSLNGRIPTKSNPVMKTIMSDIPTTSIVSISEMNKLLLQNRASSHSMSLQQFSRQDQELLSAKLQIENAPIVKNDQELYAPLFRNVSMFKRSYELMERMLKVYIYKEGARPIFHQPVLKGIYASEGWFMKIMEANKQFVIKDPRKAHLFYMPFSSRMLQVTLYVPNSHSHKNLVEHLKSYLDMITAKYPFWNRTGGADHFLAACHDWAPAETRLYMANCIRALCNADVNEGFKIGKDVSLPETFLQSPQNPLRDLGGKPPSQRTILAFFAGRMHGYVRPILLQYWENKDPDMKIFGKIGRGNRRKMSYSQYMKSSKYCICAKGYEVNSPRVVEAILYECVPVIISDNFVPPFFEILKWEAFAVFVMEKDIPNLKNILLSIPEKKYLKMQKRVRSVQKHFLWHKKPVKYDLFHMTLHSIWYNRVFQL